MIVCAFMKVWTTVSQLQGCDWPAEGVGSGNIEYRRCESEHPISRNYPTSRTCARNAITVAVAQLCLPCWLRETNLAVRMRSVFSVTLRENNLTSPVLSRMEQNFCPRETNYVVSNLRFKSFKNPFYIQKPYIEQIRSQYWILRENEINNTSIQGKNRKIVTPQNFLLGFARITRSSKSEPRSAEIRVSAELWHPCSCLSHCAKSWAHSWCFFFFLFSLKVATHTVT